MKTSKKMERTRDYHVYKSLGNIIKHIKRQAPLVHIMIAGVPIYFRNARMKYNCKKLNYRLAKLAKKAKVNFINTALSESKPLYHKSRKRLSDLGLRTVFQHYLKEVQKFVYNERLSNIHPNEKEFSWEQLKCYGERSTTTTIFGSEKGTPLKEIIPERKKNSSNDTNRRRSDNARGRPRRCESS